MPIEEIKAISLTREIVTTGNSPLLTICDNYSSYIIKNNRCIKPSLELINEIICHYFLRQWDILTPDIALVKMNPELLTGRILSNRHATHYYDDISFGSKQMENVTDISKLMDVLDTKHDYNKFTEPFDFLKIALFDIWVDNDDRKPTNFNLLIDSEMRFVAIDHAYTFCTMNYRNLLPEVSITHNSSILDTNMAKGIARFGGQDVNLSTYFNEYFYLCVERCQQNYEQIVHAVPDCYEFSDELRDSVRGFLFNNDRNNAVLETFYNWIT